MKKNKFFGILCAFLFGVINAQVEPRDVKSPNATSFERYGKYNVSLSNGTVDVNIPIHQVQLQNGVIDLRLNYDTSGLKISQPSGSTGMNWSLQMPGVITRQVNGYPDESKVKLSNGTLIGNHFYYPGELNYPNIETQAGLQNFHATRSLSTSNDLQPDVFTFNFLGKTGKFFLGQDGTWKVQSEDNLKIIIKQEDFFKPFNYTPPINGTIITPHDPISIGKILITDDIGNQYVFGADSNSIEFNTSNFYQQGKILSTAWYLNEMRDKLGNILFTCSYNRGKPIANFYNNVNIPIYIYQMLSGTLISPVYLSKINTKNEEILFDYSDRNDLTYANDSNLANKFLMLPTNNNTTSLDSNWPQKLYHLYTNFNQSSTGQLPFGVYSSWLETSKLLVWNKLDKITIKTNLIKNKEISFEYVNQPTERLFLTKVKFSNNSYGQTSEYDYKFKYNNGNDTEYMFDGTLPKYLWLGANIFDSYTSYTEPSAHCYIDCGTNNTDNLAKKGSLFKVIYPTGGFTYFNFEQNSFSKYLQLATSDFYIQTSSNRKTGGLRIKKIVNFSDMSSLKRETISYKYLLNDEHNSSGILSVDANFASGSNGLPYYADLYSSINGVKFTYYGPPISYSRVLEEKEGENGTQKTEYQFSNYDTSPLYNDKAYIVRLNIGVTPNYNTKYIDRSFLRGKLLEKKIYNSNNLLLDYTSYLYNFNNLEDRYVRSFKFGEVPSELTKIYYGDIFLEKEIKREYFNGKEFKTETTYNKTDYPYQNSGTPIYNGSQRTNFTSTLLPDGNTLKSETEYQFNCASGNCFDEVFSLPKKIKNFNNNLLLSQDEITYKTLNANPKSLVVDEAKKTYFNNAAQSSKLKFTRYDSYGNVIEYQKENGNYVSVIMDSKGSKPLAKIEGIQYDGLASYLPNIQKPYISNSSDALTNQADPVAYANAKDIELRGYVAGMRNNLSNAMVTSYTYDSYDRLKTVTAPNQSVEFYQYDGLGRLLNIKDMEGRILREYSYNYSANTSTTYPFFLEKECNDVKKVMLVKNNCANGLTGDTYVYTVPNNTYCSYINSTDINDQVNADILANGQNEANANGNCIVMNEFGLTPLSTIQLHTSSLYLNNNSVSGYFVFKPIVTMNSHIETYIARVPDNMKPSAERYYSYHQLSTGIDRYWTFVIKTNGYIFVSMNGTPLSSGESISISNFQYQK
ncbi:hypothetical protein CHRY9390_01638 [Chryseobacterium aquaeductus]|uniref:DUF5977 domain-containing protein n=1 Tax=Chryseobacterium aquaeductus TaxID=2675056 RepID=A0A9N8QSF7_9FLAO|nr:DUF5977 domain-containing protein [Chryseobacterium aquaeductus]CAA7330959.1 hypothetical protein CHRY9390_01638 [Chryseobacterium potabilaquae]CAD7807304.1 hypothetical protein CHRY9390_01638 [Chryseobacterium aquaeductus]